MMITVETDSNTGRTYYLAYITDSTTGRKTVLEAPTRSEAMALAFETLASNGAKR